MRWKYSRGREARRDKMKNEEGTKAREDRRRGVTRVGEGQGKCGKQ